jgi:hypothetical protein
MGVFSIGNLNFIDNLIEQKLLNLHTCFLARVISVADNLKSAKIQPLGKIKAYGEDAKTQSPLSAVPIASSARYKFTRKTLDYINKDTKLVTQSADGYLTSAYLAYNNKAENFALAEPIEAGDIVVCICGERNITDARKGINNTPPAGHHSMSDAIIIGIL